MDQDQKQALLAAVNLLITSPDAHRLLDSIEAVAHVAAQHPVRLTGEASDLNALLKLRAADRAAYDRVLGLVEEKRAGLGYDPLRKPKDAGYDKTEYMRNFMGQKRQRQRRAAEIENMLRKEKDRLRGDSRLEFMRRQSEKWKLQRDSFLDRVKEHAGSSTLSKEQMQAGLAKFWAAVDAELDARHAAARAEMLNPGSKRRVLELQLDSLLSALQDDPYRK